MKVGKYFIILICFSFIGCKQSNHIEKQTTLEDSLFKELVKKYDYIPHIALGGNNSFENIFKHLGSLTSYPDSVQADFYDMRPDMISSEFPMVKLTYNKKAFLVPCNLTSGSYRRDKDSIMRINHKSFDTEISAFLSYYDSYYKKDSGREKRTLDLLHLLFTNSLKAEEFQEADTLLLSEEMIKFMSRDLTKTEPEKQKEVYNGLKKRVSLFVTDYNKNIDFVWKAFRIKDDYSVINSNNKMIVYYKIFGSTCYSFLKVTIQDAKIEAEYFNPFYNHILHI